MFAKVPRRQNINIEFGCNTGLRQIDVHCKPAINNSVTCKLYSKYSFKDVLIDKGIYLQCKLFNFVDGNAVCG